MEQAQGANGIEERLARIEGILTRDAERRKKRRVAKKAKRRARREGQDGACRAHVEGGWRERAAQAERHLRKVVRRGGDIADGVAKAVEELVEHARTGGDATRYVDDMDVTQWKREAEDRQDWIERALGAADAGEDESIVEAVLRLKREVAGAEWRRNAAVESYSVMQARAREAEGKADRCEIESRDLEAKVQATQRRAEEAEAERDELQEEVYSEVREKETLKRKAASLERDLAEARAQTEAREEAIRTQREREGRERTRTRRWMEGEAGEEHAGGPSGTGRGPTARECFLTFVAMAGTGEGGERFTSFEEATEVARKAWGRVALLDDPSGAACEIAFNGEAGGTARDAASRNAWDEVARLWRGAEGEPHEGQQAYDCHEAFVVAWGGSPGIARSWWEMMKPAYRTAWRKVAEGSETAGTACRSTFLAQAGTGREYAWEELPEETREAWSAVGVLLGWRVKGEEAERTKLAATNQGGEEAERSELAATNERGEEADKSDLAATNERGEETDSGVGETEIDGRACYAAFHREGRAERWDDLEEEEKIRWRAVAGLTDGTARSCEEAFTRSDARSVGGDGNGAWGAVARLWAEKGATRVTAEECWWEYRRAEEGRRLRTGQALWDDLTPKVRRQWEAIAAQRPKTVKGCRMVLHATETLDGLQPASPGWRQVVALWSEERDEGGEGTPGGEQGAGWKRPSPVQCRAAAHADDQEAEAWWALEVETRARWAHVARKGRADAATCAEIWTSHGGEGGTPMRWDRVAQLFEGQAG